MMGLLRKLKRQTGPQGKQQKPTKAVVSCPECKRSINLERCIRQRPLAAVDGVTEVGIECPACQHWTHSFYETAEIKRARAELETVKGGTLEAITASKEKFAVIYKGEQERVAGLVANSSDTR